MNKDDSTATTEIWVEEQNEATVVHIPHAPTVPYTTGYYWGDVGLIFAIVIGPIWLLGISLNFATWMNWIKP